MRQDRIVDQGIRRPLIWLVAGVFLSAALAAVVARFVLAQVNGAVRRKTVILEMSWKRGDNYYGPNFIHLESPCLSSPFQGCSCFQDFKITRSQEFADYVASFEDKKVPVKYHVDYDLHNQIVGAILQAVGEWPSERFHTNESSLGMGFRTVAHHAPGGHFRSPADCFPKVTN